MGRRLAGLGWVQVWGGGRRNVASINLTSIREASKPGAPHLHLSQPRGFHRRFNRAPWELHEQQDLDIAQRHQLYAPMGKPDMPGILAPTSKIATQVAPDVSRILCIIAPCTPRGPFGLARCTLALKFAGCMMGECRLTLQNLENVRRACLRSRSKFGQHRSKSVEC